MYSTCVQNNEQGYITYCTLSHVIVGVADPILVVILKRCFYANQNAWLMKFYERIDCIFIIY